MSAAEVLADHHVLYRLPWSGHVHAVREVLPPRSVVVRLLLQDLVGLVPDNSRDVVGLGGSASGVDEDDSVRAHQGVIKRTSEKLVVSAVHGVTALEGDDIDVVGEGLADLGGGTAREVADREVESCDLAAHVILAALGGNHERSRVLNLAGAVALLALVRLVGRVLVGELNSGNVAVSVLEEDDVSRLEVLVIRVEYNGQAEDKTVRKRDIVNDVLVRLFIHESSKGREATVHDQFDIAKLARRELKLFRALGNSRGLLLVRLENQVDEGSTVGNLLRGLQLSSGGSDAHGSELSLADRSSDRSSGRRRGER
mmetsp:Transcript_20789/g.47042  ORF Transcript_20789/g.47042 Transcript_20789/m.47042 type:complete len:313 (-) Transcript_20789:99-1037(-)